MGAPPTVPFLERSSLFPAHSYLSRYNALDTKRVLFIFFNFIVRHGITRIFLCSVFSGQSLTGNVENLFNFINMPLNPLSEIFISF